MKIDRANTYISLGLAIVLVGAVAAGGFAWGQLDERVDQLEDDKAKVEAVEDQVQMIDKKQTKIIANQEAQKEAQEKFEHSLIKALDDINRKLDDIE